jgi:hypothetical protein
MFLISSSWLGYPQKSLTATDQDFSQHPLRAINLSSSMDSIIVTEKKVKFTLELAMKVQRGSRGTALHLL